MKKEFFSISPSLRRLARWRQIVTVGRGLTKSCRTAKLTDLTFLRRGSGLSRARQPLLWTL